jgi:putative endonuclease
VYFVYILSCRDGTLYTGYTSKLEKRLLLHRQGRGARYTCIHGAKEIVYVERFGERKEAIRRERQIKRLTRGMKLRLIMGSGKLI